MLLFAQIMTAVVLLIHVYIFLLETLLFRKRGWKVFHFSAEHIELLRPIVSNQGCYNAFLVAALALGLTYPQVEVARAFTFYGLGSVAFAGVWGAATIMPRILLIQTLPAGLALLAYALA
jgi:putative membrane protein